MSRPNNSQRQPASAAFPAVYSDFRNISVSFFRPLQLFVTDSMFVTTIIVILGIFLSKSFSHLPTNRAGDS
jgi:hypothetical protein